MHIFYIFYSDLKRYDIDFLFEADLDYNAAFTMTSELVALEVINRIFITLFEVLFALRTFCFLVQFCERFCLNSYSASRDIDALGHFETG